MVSLKSRGCGNGENRGFDLRFTHCLIGLIVLGLLVCQPETVSAQTQEFIKAGRQGQSLVEKGLYKEGVPYWQKALELLEREFGNDHLQTAMGVEGLGWLYHKQFRYTDAEPLYKRALAIREETLGPEHPKVGNSGTGKTHIALGLGLAACQKGLSVGFITAAALVHELMEARDEKRLLRFQKQLAKYKLLIIDELGFVPLSKTGAELLFEVFSQRYERGSTLLTSNLPFDEWTEVFGSERLTGALLDRLTHHVHILEMNGDSYRLNQSKKRRKSPKI